MTPTDTSTEALSLQELATKATIEVTNSLLEHFQKAGDDKSFRRAMFRQGGEYGCTMVIEVHLAEGDKSARIVTKMGKA